MSDNIAIKVENVSKTFKLPHEKNSSIKGAVLNFYKRKKTFEKQEVLNSLSFEIRKGEFFGIVGRNGSGKSTLLKLLAGIYSPSKGSVSINGKLTPFIELGVGFSPELTGRENVFLNGALLGFSRREMTKLYEDIVSFAELERFMDQKLKNYSSGMQVRLAFSIAIRAKSDILVLDEVLAVGDAAFQRKCYDYFMSLKKDGRTVVLVTHDMGAVRQFCDKAIMIEKGLIVDEGDPEKVAQAYQKLFLKENNTDKGTTKNSAKDKHWGTGKLVANTPILKVDKESILISCTYDVVENIPAPILGFTIYGPSGKNILEGNTLRQKYKTNSSKKGDKIFISWSVPNIFATGAYDVSIACCNITATEFYDWFNDAASFIISKEGNTAGTVDPPLTIKSYQTQ